MKHRVAGMALAALVGAGVTHVTTEPNPPNNVPFNHAQQQLQGDDDWVDTLNDYCAAANRVPYIAFHDQQFVGGCVVYNKHTVFPADPSGWDR